MFGHCARYTSNFQLKEIIPGLHKTNDWYIVGEPVKEGNAMQKVGTASQNVVDTEPYQTNARSAPETWVLAHTALQAGNASQAGTAQPQRYCDHTSARSSTANRNTSPRQQTTRLLQQYSARQAGDTSCWQVHRKTDSVPEVILS